MSGGIEWTLAVLATIAASAAIVAAGLALGRLGVVAGLLGAHIGRCAKQFGTGIVGFIGGAVVALLLLPVALARPVRTRKRA